MDGKTSAWRKETGIYPPIRTQNTPLKPAINFTETFVERKN
jgi:hypothetical protein